MPGKALTYGQSITDGCIDWDTTVCGPERARRCRRGKTASVADQRLPRAFGLAGRSVRSGRARIGTSAVQLTCRAGATSDQRSAAAADALDLLVERGVFLAQRIVRIAQVLLARARRRRAAGDGRPAPGSPAAPAIRLNSSRPPRPCANAAGPPIRTTSAIDKDCFPHLGSPVSIVYFIASVPERRSAAQLRRPWAAQSCTLRTSAMVPSNQIPAATSTHEEAEHHRVLDRCDCPRLPAAPVSHLPPPSSADHGFRRIEMNVAAIIDDTIARFPSIVHVPAEFACDK